MKRRLVSRFLLLVLVLTGLSAGCARDPEGLDYARPELWAYAESEAVQKPADLFFVCPTVYGGGNGSFSMSLEDTDTMAAFLGAIRMELGIYRDSCRVFAPYYRQAGLSVYALPPEEREPYLELAYRDVAAAFSRYLEHENQGRPLVLAGFSQGADLCLRLMKDFFGDEQVSRLLVACYAIGWSVTGEELAEYPHLSMAAGEADTGVIVTFNSEAEYVQDSLTIPAGTHTAAINPLNWKTDSTPADRSQNLGACFTDYEGAIVSEIPALTGAYLDPVRGALKVTDVTAEEYPPGLSLFGQGVYHLYDYQFFYRNLQENVALRVDRYLQERHRR